MSDNLNTKQRFFESVLEAVRNIPISELIQDEYKVPAGVCPFHEDKSPGSFSFSDRHRRYRCWSCQAEGDAIKFVQEMEEIKFEPAVIKLAVLFEVITSEQAELYFKGKGFHEVEVKKARAYVEHSLYEEDGYRASQEVIHNVFSVLALGDSIIDGKKKLNEAHLTYLLEERGFSTEIISQGDYFSMPSRTMQYQKQFFQRLKDDYGYEPNIVEGVPGFYKSEKTKRGNGYTFSTNKGIGIPVRSFDGKISGIQIRRDVVKKKESRYIWMSSSFANKEEDLSFGTGAGAPVHVSYPIQNKYPNVVFLTEGIFKSEAIARTFDSTAISLQGILSWKKHLFETIDGIEQIEQSDIKHLYVIFDADISSNIHVFEGCRDVVNGLKEFNPDMQLFYAWWEPEYGKGIDDLIQEGYLAQMKKVDAFKFIDAYTQAVGTLEDRVGLDVKLAIKEYGNECLKEVFNEFVKPIFANKIT